ncbi:MAG: hypothetical protein HQ548_05125 [Chloroflexi bacterium]|nr:hypothetical protein [Chloroflexota bacterium]
MASPEVSWFAREREFVFDLFEFRADDSRSEAEQRRQFFSRLEQLGLRDGAAGAYVFSADPKELGEQREGFVYPLGRSTVYYIGQTADPFQRFLGYFVSAGWAAWDFDQHNYQAFTDPTRSRHHPRDAYAAPYGARVHWWETRAGETPEALETDLMMAFCRKYGTIPVANLKWSKLEATVD